MRRMRSLNLVCMCAAGAVVLSLPAGLALAEPGTEKSTELQATKKEPSLEQFPGESDEAYARRLLNQARRAPQGPDLESERGIAMFTREWTYIPAPLDAPDGVLITSAATLDVEGNLIIADSAQGGALVQKLDGADNDEPSLIWQGFAFGRVFDIAADLDGDLYLAVAGAYPGIQKMSGSFGGTVWVESLSQVSAFSVDGMTIVLDGDGTPFVLTELDTGFETTVLLTRVDPISGQVAWEVEIPDMEFARLTIDRRGDLLLAGTIGGTQARLYKFDGPRGTELWSSALFPLTNPQVTDVEVDLEDSVVVSLVGDSTVSGNQSAVQKFTRAGIELSGWTLTQSSAIYTDVAIDRAGYVTVAWTHSTNKDVSLFQKHPETGAIVWTNGIGSDDSGPPAIGSLCLDRLGNIYLHCSITLGGQPGVVVAKYKVAQGQPDNGSLAWYDAQEVQAGYLTQECIVDAGASIYTVGVEFLPADPDVQSLLTKYTQPFTDVPTLREGHPNLVLENQGVWFPGTGAIEKKGVIWELPPVDFDTNDIPLQDFFFTPLGEFGGGPRLRADADITLGYKAEVNGGTADYQFPMDVQFLIPGFRKVFAGVVIPDILVDWDPDPAARMTSNATPSIDAGLTAETTGSIYADLKLTAFSFEVLDDVIVNESWDVVPEDYIPPLHVLGLLGQFGLPAPGEWITVADSNGIFTGSARLPKLSAKSDLTVPATGPNAGKGVFRTNVESDFLKLRVSLTQAIARMFGGTLALEKKFGDEDDTFYAAFSAAFAQATFGANLGAEQTLEVVVTPRVRYEFSDGLPSMDLELGEPISGLVMPPDGTLEITPFVYATTTFANDTDMTLSPTAGFSTLEFSVAADFDGWRLVGLSECILCIDEELLTVNIDILNLGWNTMVFPEVELAPIRVTGSTDVQPRLAAASRAAMSMAMYNQTAPSQSNFNVISRGTSRMLLFGDRLFEGSEAVIKHHGRTECLPTSWINDNTLLVEVPNRFRLLPGVASIWVESQFGISESIDLPIEYPVPRLDTVNPNLWSADPDMNVLPVAVIDGGSTIGNDTFIARRDYYIKMRDELWNANTVTGNPIYSTSPALSIPDGSGQFVASTIMVPDAGSIQDVNVRLVVDHTYNGDLIVRLSHNGVTRTLVDRPGRTTSGFGFNNDGFSIWLDDEGSGGLIENVDSGGPAVISPPSYVPQQALSAFDGQNRSGAWTLEISDNAGDDTGALVGWSLEFTGGGPIGAQAYFPCFDFNQLPAFPGVFFDGVPMERYAQPVDSGIHNIRLAETDYDTPRAVQVVLCNPGPGGGASTPATLTIAAPAPAITSIEPREVEPDTEDFDIIVRGPKHVPFWPEYEEPKYGNFNRDSEIRFNGTPLPTTFVGSAELRATVPASLINGQERNHVVTVFTPDNGTSYFEELRDGSGDIVFQGLMPSGGESAGLLFVSRYQDPVIDTLSPDSTEVGNMAFADGVQEYNVTVCGEHFRSTSQVMLGGEPRPTNFISSTMLEVRLSPEDVASPRFAYMTVRNFNGAVSQPAEFLVTAPPPAPAGFGRHAPASREATTRIER